MNSVRKMEKTVVDILHIFMLAKATIIIILVLRMRKLLTVFQTFR